MDGAGWETFGICDLENVFGEEVSCNSIFLRRIAPCACVVKLLLLLFADPANS